MSEDVGDEHEVVVTIVKERQRAFDALVVVWTLYLAGRPSRNKGRRYPADPPRTEEIIAVTRWVCTAIELAA